MEPVDRPRNLAARMGRWSASHRKTAIFGWLAFIAISFAVGGAIGTQQLADSDSGAGESGHVQSVLADHFKQPISDIVLIQSKTSTADDAIFRAAVDDVTRSVAALPQVKDVHSPYSRGYAEQISKDRHTARVTLSRRTTDEEKAQKFDEPVQKALAAAGTRHPAVTVEEFGVNVNTEIDKAVADDFLTAGVASVPITLIVLVIAFGALVAAGLPLLLALTAVVATTGLLALPSQLMPMSADVGVIVLLIGLAVGVDYAMFYLKREREERAAGRSASAALEAAAATSGRAVLTSGLTVMVAMGGMLFTGDKTFMGFGIATIIVVAIAVLGSLTVLPATMAVLGDRVEKFRLPLIHRLHKGKRSGGLWSAVLDRVLRRPIISVVLAGGFLVALAAPALNLHVADPSSDTLPQNLSSVQTLNKMQKAFPDNSNTAEVMVSSDDAHS